MFFTFYFRNLVVSAAASMSSYNMEGTKKQGISAKRKAKLLAKARAAAEKASK